MNISDLKQFDLKGLDVQNILDDLKNRKELLIRVVIVIAAGLGMFFVYSNRQLEAARLKDQIPLLEEKTKIIEQFKASESEKGEFIENFSQISEEDEFKNFITDLIEKYHIKIQSISPLEVTSDAYYENLKLQITFIADDFIQMVLFIHEIESSGMAMRIENWQGQMQDTYSRGEVSGKESTSKPISGQIKIAALRIKK